MVRMNPQRLSFQHTQPLHSVAATRQMEQAGAAASPPHTLMQRAGLSVARLLCSLAPHARIIWVACGPGNNGGDGLEAAMHLQQWGLQPQVTWLGDEATAPSDALASLRRARQAGVRFVDDMPEQWDAAVDALLGVGASRAPQGRMLQCLHVMAQGAGVVLHVDVPSGLDADTGQWISNFIAPYAFDKSNRNGFHIKKSTLSLLTLKPGLFTAHGRDACGEIWFDDLGVQTDVSPQARLLGALDMQAPPRPHASHKGSYGDVAVIGGASGMQGAALLAARAALYAGAGRVFVGLLGGGMVADLMQPELMCRAPDTLDVGTQTVVCGCGGGEAVRQVLPRVLSTSARLVLDADALNAIAQELPLQDLLKSRAVKGLPTILTPHPLEAARLLGQTTAEVQADRLKAAQTLANRHACTVILKGSGSIIASPEQLPAINPTGDARLATPGTGDVLAGLCGSFLAHENGTNVQASAMQAARRACWTHGALVDVDAGKHSVHTAAIHPDAHRLPSQGLVVPASELLRRLL